MTGEQIDRSRVQIRQRTVTWTGAMAADPALAKQLAAFAVDHGKTGSLAEMRGQWQRVQC